MWKRLYLKSCHMNCKNGKYLANTMDNSVITCDEIIESSNTKTLVTISRHKERTKRNYVLTI